MQEFKLLQNRFRSKAAWTCTIALILFVLKTYTKIEIPKVDELITLVFAFLSVLGFFNNPENPEGY